MFQTAKMARRSRVTRMDHIWRELRGVGEQSLWKCCLCGAICHEPPDTPTPPDWEALRYEKVAEEDRQAAPFQG